VDIHFEGFGFNPQSDLETDFSVHKSKPPSIPKFGKYGRYQATSMFQRPD
jgi:hypothetical protein